MRLPSETKQQLFLKNLFSENGLLYSGTGIFLAVAGTQTTEQAFFLGSICLILILFNSIVSAISGDIFRYKIPLWIMALLTAIILAFLHSIFREKISSLPKYTGILMYLMVAGPVVYSRAQTFSHTTALDRAIFDAAGQGTGILLVMIAIAFVRESLGTGNLGATAVLSRPAWPLLASVLGGFILTGLTIIIYRILISRRSK